MFLTLSPLPVIRFLQTKDQQLCLNELDRIAAASSLQNDLAYKRTCVASLNRCPRPLQSNCTRSLPIFCSLEHYRSGQPRSGEAARVILSCIYANKSVFGQLWTSRPQDWTFGFSERAHFRHQDTLASSLSIAKRIWLRWIFSLFSDFFPLPSCFSITTASQELRFAGQSRYIYL